MAGKAIGKTAKMAVITGPINFFQRSADGLTKAYHTCGRIKGSMQ
jgi:hypothetical protein